MPESTERPPTGACYNCGFLSRHDILNTHLSIFPELTEEDRERHRYLKGGITGFNLPPWCFRGKPILREISEVVGTAVPPPSNAPEKIWTTCNDAAVSEFTRDRKCTVWSRFHPGLDARMHLEEVRMQELEQQRRDWEARMERERSALDQRLARDNKEFLRGLEGERRRWEKESGKWPNRLIIAAVILAVAEVIAAIIVLPEATRWLGLD